MLRRADKINFLHKLSPSTHSTKNCSWFGVEARCKSKYPQREIHSPMNGSHRVYPDFAPSVPRTGQLEGAIFSYLLVFEAMLHLCWLHRPAHSDMHRPAHSEQPIWEQQPEIIAATELDLKNSDLYQVKYARGSSSRKDFSSSLKTNRTSQALLWRKASHTCVNNPWYLVLQGVKSLLQHVCPAGRKEQACPWTCLIFQTAPELDRSQELSKRYFSFRAWQGCDLSPFRQSWRQEYVWQGAK